ncbi:hypothetical protein ACX80J_00905 [Arthrobacter sp. MDB2-24]
MLVSSGLDDRKTSNGYLQRAQDLMAEAVGADRTFFSTCGRSLSVKAAILAVTHGEGEILIGRDSQNTWSRDWSWAACSLGESGRAGTTTSNSPTRTGPLVVDPTGPAGKDPR